MSTILQILLGAPTWVYVVFVYLFVFGILSLRDSVVKDNRMVIVPIVFTAWSIYSLFNKHGFSFGLFGLWLIPFIIGSFIGRHLFSRGIEINKKDMVVHIAGSAYPFILYMAFFVTKYAIGALSAMKPELASHVLVWGTDLMASSLISGMFLGRFLVVLRKYYQALYPLKA